VRVAFHADQLWFSAPGGIGTYVRELLFRLHDDDVELVPFSSRWAHHTPAGPIVERGPTMPRVDLPMQMLYPAWSVLRRPALPSRFGHLDAVHAANHAAIPPTRRGQALVATVHDLAFERFPELFPDRWRRLYERGVRIAIDEADVILVPSAYVRDELVQRGVDVGRLRVTPLAAARASQPEEGSGGDEPPGDMPPGPFLLAVGTIEPRKNLPRLVRAFRDAVARAAVPHHLVIAGPAGWHHAELIELQRAGDDRVRLVGRLSELDLELFYRRAAATAYVSLYEGFGLPVIDALARGVPTLASNIGAITEVAGDAALLVDPLDEDALADGIVRILTDDTLRAELSAKGPERAARYSWEATARATLAAYREVSR
jgi:glycosyltransferase involved in cell wall biosynthesis